MKKTGKGNNKDMEQKNSFTVRTNLKQFKKQTKGITLIALVITIIVLLILAAVTIATLTGDNGILTRASDASERTREANALEQVQIAVQGSYDETGKINIDDLNTELSRIDDLTSGLPLGSLPATVVVDGYEITIDNDGVASLGKSSEDNWNATDSKYFSFGFDTENKTAQLTGINSDYLSEDGVIVDGDTRITSIVIPKSVKNASGEDYTVTGIASDSFVECGLEEVTIPDSVTAIGGTAFSFCSALKKLTIGSGVTEIGGNAFGNCYSLQEIIYLGVDEPEIGESAFYNVAVDVQVPKEYESLRFGALGVTYSLD